jgi:hypothetical protein
MESKLPFFVLCAIFIAFGVAAIWLAHLGIFIFAIAGLAFAYTLERFRAGQPLPPSEAGFNGGGEFIPFDIDSGDGGGGH